MRRVIVLTGMLWALCAGALAQWPWDGVTEALSFKDSTDTGTRAVAYAHDSVKIYVDKGTSRGLCFGDEFTSPVFLYDILRDATAATTYVTHATLLLLDNLVTTEITTSKLITGSGGTEVLKTTITSSTIAAGSTSCTLTCTGFVPNGWCVTTSILGPDDGGLFAGYGSTWQKQETGQIDVCITSATFCTLTVWGRFDRIW